MLDGNERMTIKPSQMQAVVLAIAGYTMWVLADASMKLAGGTPLPAYEIVGLIGVFEALFLVAASFLRPGALSLRPKHPGRQSVRSCLDLVNNLCVVVAVRHLPLALFYILVFLAPIVTSLLAAMVLGESLRPKQILAILTGFVGVVIAVDPARATRAEGWAGYLACLVCVLCFSTNMVWSRRMTQDESAESLVFSSALIMAAAGALGSVYATGPLSGRLVLILAITAVFCILGSTCFFIALRHTTAATVSQFHYSQLLTGAFVAYLGWHERPTAAMLAGAVLIVSAGAYTAANVAIEELRPVPVLLTTPE